ncbi:hypothetical protein Pla163_12470 [Planctomycetes bacterium Pla163]|uniref:PDZ domain-containing protein n=1 Tax=Rohdeia mirabilis TaxID=2528008 RepID=A0A518CY33_9BACT|nr:hypothetical protein Pla163_12470 [Planctomycetes bacterium Pla163]
MRILTSFVLAHALLLGSWASPLHADRLATTAPPDALELDGDGRLELAVTVPARTEVEGLDPKGWYVTVQFDVLESAPDVRLEVTLDGEPLGLYVLATLADVSGPLRVVARLDAARTADLPERSTLVVRSVGGRVVLANPTVERFHTAPTPKLLGKANGVLGPDRLDVGALGLVALTEHQCRAFSILAVRAGGAAERAGLRVGDLVVAVDDRPLPVSSVAPGWEWFEASHESVIGHALESAARAGRTSVAFTVLRPEGGLRVELDQPFRPAAFGIDGENLGDALDAGFPLRGPLADAFERDLVLWAESHQQKNGAWPGANEVNPGLGALALLGTGDPRHTERIERTIAFLKEKRPEPAELTGLAYWAVAYQGWLFCEWNLATGDDAVLDWVTKACAWLPTTTHESKWGTQAFGHGPDGLPYDDKALMAPAAHLLVFDALARRCGVESTVWEHIRPYVEHSWSNPANEGHGGMGYNGSYRDQDEFWSRSGLVALAEHLRGDDEAGMRGPLTALMAERHPWMFNSHAYGEPGAALGLISLAVVDRAAFEQVLEQYRWRFLANWEPGYGLRYSTPHMGAPYMAEESVVNLAYLLLMSVESGGLVMCGGAGERER